MRKNAEKAYKKQPIICFVAQFLPPIHGLSKAVDTLYNSEINCFISEEGEFGFEKVNLTDNKKILRNLFTMWRSKADLFYFTISQTKGGNLRDLVILQLLSWQGKKCLVHLHGGYYRQLVDCEIPLCQRKANYSVIRKIDGVITLSDSLKSNFAGMISDERIHVVKNCIDDEFILSQAEVSKKIEALKDKNILHVLYLSNFIRTKGYPEVLKMAKLEKERVQSGGEHRFHFDFAGGFFNKEERIFFDGYIRENSLEKYVTYHGIVEGRKKIALLRSCEILVLLTRYPAEGQPITILEGMGNAMVIITTNHAGIPDIVADGKNGIVSDYFETADSVYKNLVNMEIDKLARIALYNWNYCIGNFSRSTYIKNMSEIYKRILMG